MTHLDRTKFIESVKKIVKRKNKKKNEVRMTLADCKYLE